MRLRRYVSACCVRLVVKTFRIMLDLLKKKSAKKLRKFDEGESGWECLGFFAFCQLVYDVKRVVLMLSFEQFGH